MNEKQASVAARIAELACLPMSELWTVWDRYFPRRPDYPNRTHVESRIAYKLQEEAFGGLAPETKQRLEAIGAKHSKIKLRAKPREFDFAPGTILLREWGEREHRVTVTAEGLFEYQGRNFKSLTAVERHRIANLMIERIDLVHVGEVQGIKVTWRELGWDALIGEFAPRSIGAELVEVEA